MSNVSHYIVNPHIIGTSPSPTGPIATMKLICFSVNQQPNYLGIANSIGYTGHIANPNTMLQKINDCSVYVIIFMPTLMMRTVKQIFKHIFSLKLLLPRTNSIKRRPRQTAPQKKEVYLTAVSFVFTLCMTAYDEIHPPTLLREPLYKNISKDSIVTAIEGKSVLLAFDFSFYYLCIFQGLVKNKQGIAIIAVAKPNIMYVSPLIKQTMNGANSPPIPNTPPKIININQVFFQLVSLRFDKLRVASMNPKEIPWNNIAISCRMILVVSVKPKDTNRIAKEEIARSW